MRGNLASEKNKVHNICSLCLKSLVIMQIADLHSVTLYLLWLIIRHKVTHKFSTIRED